MRRRGASTGWHKWENDLLLQSHFYLMLFQLFSIMYFGMRSPRSPQKKIWASLSRKRRTRHWLIGWLHWWIKMNEVSDLESQTPTECKNKKEEKTRQEDAIYFWDILVKSSDSISWSWTHFFSKEGWCQKSQLCRPGSFFTGVALINGSCHFGANQRYFS